MHLLAEGHHSSSVLFLHGKPAILNIAEGIPNDLTKRRQHVPHFGLK